MTNEKRYYAGGPFGLGCFHNSLAEAEKWVRETCALLFDVVDRDDFTITDLENSYDQ